MRRHTPLQQFREACQIAHDHNMFVVEKPARGGEGTDHILYRKTPVKPQRVGSRRDVGEFRRFVERCAGLKPGN